MPGVPSGRGCEGCRKQKKKCDQKKPACGRCSRLKIDCIGNGMQRYKFKQEHVQKDSLVVVAPKSRSRQNDNPIFFPHPRNIPADATASAAGAFISVLQIQDVRYDISAFGVFFDDLPRKLGSNAALDASVAALTGAFKSLQVRDTRVQALTQYGHALKQLRKSLQDPVLARTPDTTCAIYLVLVCEQWIGDTKTYRARHSEVLWHLLHDAATNGWWKDFDPVILKTLLVTALLECTCNPNLSLDRWFYELLEDNHRPRPYKDSSGMDLLSIDIPTLAQVSEYLREPEKYRMAISTHYALVRFEYPRVHETMTQFVAKAAQPDATYMDRRLAARFQTLYAITMAVASLLNRILRSLEDDDGFLIPESEMYCDEVIAVSRAAASARPLAVSIMPFSLLMTWVTIPELPKREVVEELLAEYASDFQDGRWMERARWMKVSIDSTLPIKGPKKLLGLEQEPSEPLYCDGFSADATGGCCIL